MTNNKSLIKYRHGEENGLMHYVVFEKEVVVLSVEKSHKVEHIDKYGNLDITFDIKSKDFDAVTAEVVRDKMYVEKVYNYMIETNNAYFTEGFDNLCAIKFHK